MLVKKVSVQTTAQSDVRLFVLTIHEPFCDPRQVRLQQDELILGRANECDVQLKDQHTSNKHARLDFTAAGLIHVQDLGSSNGTFVNGQPVEEVYLQSGDQLTLGKTIITVYDQDPQSQDIGGDEITAVIERVDVANSTPLLQRFLSASRMLNQTKQLSEILKQVLEQAMKLVDGQSGFILLNDPNARGCKVALQMGDIKLPSHIEDLQVASTKHFHLNIAARAMETQQLYFVPSARDDSELCRDQAVIEGNIQAILCASMTIGDDSFGALYVDRRGLTGSENLLQFEHAALFESFAQLATTALENTRLKSDLKRETRYRSNLQRYLSPQIVEQVIAQKHQLTIGGNELRATVLFSDVRGFTALSSRLPPERLLQHLNEYFSMMAKVVLRHGGFLDKFIGDAILAVFGVPEPKAGDEERAMLAALEMQERLSRINQEWHSRGWDVFHIGIGINSGKVIAGNIGSTQRMEYTVLGDSVNVASRLCSAAEAGTIVVADSTLRPFANKFSFAPLDLPPLKGKEDQVVKAYALKSKKAVRIE